MKYIVYLTINLKNNYIYIGVHKTKTPYQFDGYYGCGISKGNLLKNPKTDFLRALKLYGFDSFKRITLLVFNTEEEAYNFEKILVNKDFIKRPDTYNMVEGGSYINPEKIIFLYDLEGNFIRQWKSIKFAAECLNICATSISQAAIYKTTCNKMLWSFNKVDKLNLNDFTVYNPEIELFIYNSQGDFIKKFDSYSSLAKEFNTSISHINRAIKCNYKINNFYISKIYLNKFIILKNTEKLTGKVHQYSLLGEYLRSFDSIKDAEEYFNQPMLGINPSIRQNKLYKGFLWLRGEKKQSLAPYKNTKGMPKKIGQYSLNGELIKVFNSVRDARKIYKNINKLLCNLQHPYKGYIFKYIS